MLADLTKALEIDPTLANAYVSRANAYGRKGEFDKAIADATKAIEINPEDASAYDNRGFAYGSKGRA